MNTARKTIATLDVTLVPEVSSRAWADAARAQHVECVLCGTSLVFKHKVEHVAGVAHEEANCPSCRVRNRTSVHTLQ